jgi:hypothetical protein
MATDQVVLRGTLKPDGSLELDNPPDLPAGPVEVILRSLSSATQNGGDWWQYLQRARAELEAAGRPFRTMEDIEQERREFRSGDDRIEDLYRQNKDDDLNGTSKT